MKFVPKSLAVAILSSATLGAHGFDSFAQTGFTGILRTPDASVIPEGELRLNYSFEEHVNRTESHWVGAHRTAILGLGVFKGFEFTTQNTHKRINGIEPGFNNGGGSDLSFSGKFSTKPFEPHPNFPVHFAIGFQDYSNNAATFHKNYYGLAEFEAEKLQVVAGFGKGSANNQMGEDYLEGPFGGIKYQVLNNLQLVADYDATGANAGLKYRYAPKWMPNGWSVLTNAQLFSSSETEGRDNRYIGFELHAPLKPKTKVAWKSPISVGYSKSPKFAEQFIAGKREQQKRQSASAAEGQAVLSQYDDVFNGKSVANALADYGFENVRVGMLNGKPVIAVENNIHNKNEVTGLGAALGIISHQWSSSFTLILLNNGLPMVAVDTRGDIVQVAITETRLPHWQDLNIYERGAGRLYNRVRWDVKTASAKFKPRVQLSVNQRSSLGTEWGVLDYSLALATNVTADLWPGAVVDVRHFTPMTKSDDVGFSGHPVSEHENTVDRILLHQAIGLGGGLMTQFSVGQVATDYHAIFNETRWQSENGAHRVSVRASRWEHQDDDRVFDPVLAYYRYYMPGQAHGVEVFGGQFQAGDNGAGFRTLHWFGDTRASLEFMDGDETYAGMYFEFPLMLDKSMKPRHWQVTGVNNWRWGYRTSIADLNVINNAALNETNLEHNLESIYYNRDRLSADYIYANLRYLFDAARVSYQGQ